MKMSKNYKKICLALGLTGILGAGAVTAQSGTQNVQATYRDIKVTYNGVTQSIATEPFLVNGSTYVPLRAVGDIFGANATWNPTSNTVVLSGGSVTSNQEEITNLNFQIAALQKELSAANAELAQYKANSSTTTPGTSTGSAITPAKLQETEDYLNDSLYDGLSNSISLGYDLSLTGNQIDVTITYETRTENNAFNKLSQSTIEKFMKRVGDNIAATHSDIAINGTIEYTNGAEEKATFTRTKAGKYSYTHAFDADTLEELLLEETASRFYFDNIGVSNLAINNFNVNVRDSRSSINVSIYLDADTTFTNTWGTPMKTESSSTIIGTSQLTPAQRKSAVTDQLDELQELLLEVSNGYEVTLTVYYGSYSDYIAEIDVDGKISTNTFTYNS